METNRPKFEMVAKTFQGLEEVLAEELRNLGAEDVEPGRRMVAFKGTLETLYRANMCCRTALRILKPICKFKASNPDQLYDRVKEFDWTKLLALDKTFSIDPVVYSDEFSNSRYVTYRVKDAIVDSFRDRFGADKRPGVRINDADIMINVHIAGTDVTLSLDSSGESLHKRGWRTGQTEAPINEVLAAGIILKTGWRGGDLPLVDPMCGSGTFLVEAAMIATGTMPGVYRRSFAFEHWDDYDEELFDSIYNDDSMETEYEGRIYGTDISPKAIEIARANLKSAGMLRYVDLEVKPLSHWQEAPCDGTPGVIVTNPPYGERISVENMDAFYELIGRQLKFVFKGYHAWIIGYRREYFDKIGLAPSLKEPLFNGNLECELREYVMFEGDYRSFRSNGGSIRRNDDRDEMPRRVNRHGKTDRRDERPRRFPRNDERGDKPRRRSDSDKPRRRFDDGNDSEPRRFAKAKGFDKGKSRFDKPKGRFDKEKREGKPYGQRPDNRPDHVIEGLGELEKNPLASRRNPNLLNDIQFGTRPSIQSPRMRGRKPRNDE